jgi:signal transduction histidine kinase
MNANGKQQARRILGSLRVWLSWWVALPAFAAAQSNLPGALPFIEYRALEYGRESFKLTPQSNAGPAGQPTRDAARVHRYEAVSLPDKGWPLRVSFDFPEGATRWAVRLRYKLEGYDAEWRDLDQYYMHVVLKFLDDRKSPVSREEFRTLGNSVGWSGEVTTSRMATRQEQAVVPPRAAWMSVWIDSGGHDETSGIWLVDNFNILETTGENGPVSLLFQEDFENGRDLEQPQGNFARWVRDGGDIGGARVWQQFTSGNHALAVVDGNPRDYSAWRLNDQNLLRVAPGQLLRLKWDEAFSIGSGRGGVANYPNLPSGHYQLRVQEVDALGLPTGEEAVLPLIVAPPYYANVWFKAALVTMFLALGLIIERLTARARNRRKLELLERRQAVQQERARIARDIHDDLGTVLSRIAMVSESAAIEAAQGSRQEERLKEICDASRQLTRTMEEIVWAQDPQRDYLDNMVDYFCSFATNLLAGSRVACRLDVPVDLPSLAIEAQKRHELFLVFKECLNNVIKHAGASEVRISLKWENHSLRLTIKDDGCGFSVPGVSASKGNGLNNMRNRLQRVGGQVNIHSKPGEGTEVEVILPVDHRPEESRA